VLVRATGAPVPGPVVGMVLLFALLRWRAVRGGRGAATAAASAAMGTGASPETARPDPPAAAEPAGLAVAADGLLKHLSLLFVPAGVGVMLHAARLADEWLAIAVALVASTVAAIAATALTMRALMPRAAQAPMPGDAGVEGEAPAATGDGADRPPREPR
jgi:holin-like protein